MYGYILKMCLKKQHHIDVQNSAQPYRSQIFGGREQAFEITKLPR